MAAATVGFVLVLVTSCLWPSFAAGGDNSHIDKRWRWFDVTREAAMQAGGGGEVGARAGALAFVHMQVVSSVCLGLCCGMDGNGLIVTLYPCLTLRP